MKTIEITQTIKELHSIYERKKGQEEQLQSTIDNLTNTIEENSQMLQWYEQALDIVKQVGLLTQKQLEYHLAEQVSLAMEAVFDDPYQLKLNFQEKRGKTEVEILFTKHGLELSPMDNVGGGAIDIASLALRIAYWSMRRDKKIRSILLLDEPFSQLKGIEANKRALAMIQEISHKLNLQVIMISDERVAIEDIIDNADKVYKVHINKDSISHIKEIHKEV